MIFRGNALVKPVAAAAVHGMRHYVSEGATDIRGPVITPETNSVGEDFAILSAITAAGPDAILP
jgi:hypothetical protein